MKTEHVVLLYHGAAGAWLLLLFLVVLIVLVVLVTRKAARAYTASEELRKLPLILRRIVESFGKLYIDPIDEIEEGQEETPTENNLRLCYVCACLCADVYDIKSAQMEQRLQDGGFDDRVLIGKRNRFVWARAAESKQKPPLILVVVRGTDDISDVETNLKVTPHTPTLENDRPTICWWFNRWSSGKCDVNKVQQMLLTILGNADLHKHPLQLHEGFWHRTMSVLKEITHFNKNHSREENQPNKKLVVLVTGHSLGGAVAHCMALLLSVVRSTALSQNDNLGITRIICLTYGQPKIFCTKQNEDADFITDKDEIMSRLDKEMETQRAVFTLHRVVSINDIVPALPPPIEEQMFTLPHASLASEIKKNQLIRFLHPPGCFLLKFKFSLDTRQARDVQIIHTKWTRSFDLRTSSILSAGRVFTKYALDLSTHRIGSPHEPISKFCCLKKKQTPWYTYKGLLQPRDKAEEEVTPDLLLRLFEPMLVEHVGLNRFRHI